MVKRLIWYDKRFNRIHRLRRPLLTLEEANERMHIHFPNIDILDYYGMGHTALLYCSDCGETFTTRNSIGPYIYGGKKYCESCKNKSILNTIHKLLGERGLRFLNYYNPEGRNVKVVYTCDVCNEVGEVWLPALEKEKLKGCQNCKLNSRVARYVQLLLSYNLHYISYDGRLNGSELYYECNVCGYSSSVHYTNLSSGTFGGCPGCNVREINIKHLELFNSIGFKYTKSHYDYAECIHLFCGKSSEVINYHTRTLCNYCKNKVIQGKAKQHNKHLVTECEKILKYTLDLKNEIQKHNIDLEQIKANINYDFIKDIYTYIEGWYDNFIKIKTKYPNGDLGTVLENNPYYTHVWEIVVPAFEELLNSKED